MSCPAIRTKWAKFGKNPTCFRNTFVYKDKKGNSFKIILSSDTVECVSIGQFGYSNCSFERDEQFKSPKCSFEEGIIMYQNNVAGIKNLNFSSVLSNF